MFPDDGVTNTWSFQHWYYGNCQPDNKMPSFLYACLSMDSVAATYGLGKTNAIAMARKGNTLDLLGQLVADINKVVKEATLFIAAYDDFTTLCSSMADCCQQQCAYKIGTSTPAPKLCSLLPTTIEQYFRRAHHQVALWYSVLSRDAPAMNAVEYGWEWHDINIRLMPRDVLM